jgi:hypothetical protein
MVRALRRWIAGRGIEEALMIAAEIVNLNAIGGKITLVTAPV